MLRPYKYSQNISPLDLLIWDLSPRKEPFVSAGGGLACSPQHVQLETKEGGAKMWKKEKGIDSILGRSSWLNSEGNPYIKDDPQK